MRVVWRRLRVLCCAALVLIPVALSGHVHVGPDAAPSACPSCIAARHTPSVAAMAMPLVEAELVAGRVNPPPPPPLAAESHHGPCTGRSPPGPHAAVS
jgi:hypothetical protein